MIDGAFRPQLSTDGFTPYPHAIANSFGEMIRYGVLIKNDENPESGQYAPPEICDADYRPQ